jgi:SAM-dependent methyltransferase
MLTTDEKSSLRKNSNEREIMGSFHPDQEYIGGYTPNDGTVEFYGRVRSQINSEHTVLDLGGGRGAWFEDDPCDYRRSIRYLKGSVKELIAADVDQAVLQNRTCDRSIVYDKTVPLPDKSVDIIVSDYVIEHVVEVDHFVSEIRRLLKPSGWFCARTPHKLNYVALGTRIVPNSNHASFLKGAQPGRKEEDVFPTAYKLNTLKSIKRSFEGFGDFSYVFRPDPAYFFGSKGIYRAMKVVHQLAPAPFSGNIFVFLRKN